MNRILEAAQFSANAHAGQFRKYGDNPLPYAVHPARVAGWCAILPEASEEMVITAYLHDVLEDTTVTVNEIRQKFGQEVADMVIALTKIKFPGENRKARNERYLLGLQAANQCVQTIKLLDRIDNLQDIVGGPVDFQILYAKESIELNAALHGANVHLAIRLRQMAERILRKNKVS